MDWLLIRTIADLLASLQRRIGQSPSCVAIAQFGARCGHIRLEFMRALYDGQRRGRRHHASINRATVVNAADDLAFAISPRLR